MAQVKKESTRNAIIDSARRLFKQHGYLKCSMSVIAKDAGMAVANIYVYFPTKMHVLYEVIAPTLIARMTRLSQEAALIDAPESRLRFILLSLWRDIPEEKETCSRNLLEAIVTAPHGAEKPHELLRWSEHVLDGLLRACLPDERRVLLDDAPLAFLFWMAFDGFVVNAGSREVRDIESLVDKMVHLLLGKAVPRALDGGRLRLVHVDN